MPNSVQKKIILHRKASGTYYDLLPLTTADMVIADDGDTVQDLLGSMRTAVNSKAEVKHSHAISEIDGLQSSLDSKLSAANMPHIKPDSSSRNNPEFGDIIPTYLTVGTHMDEFVRGLPSFSAGVGNKTPYYNGIALGLSNSTNKNGIAIGVSCRGGAFSGSSDKSIAIGFGAEALSGNIALGMFNKPMTPNPMTSATGDILVIGNGTGNFDDNGHASGMSSNAFRVQHDGAILSVKGYQSSGADYAERFEWLDGNPNNEDRVGRFVTLEGEKIQLSIKGENYVGIVSSTPAIIGDSQSEEWAGRFETDIFGRRLYDENGRWIISPEHKEDIPYVPRAERKEWGCVGMLGKLVVIDDGSCQINGYAQPTFGGIATYSIEPTRCRVMARLDANHIRVLLQ